MGRTTGNKIKKREFPKIIKKSLEFQKTIDLNKDKPMRGAHPMAQRRIDLGLPTRVEERKKKLGLSPEPIYDGLRFPHIGYTLSKEYGFTQAQLAQVFDVKLNTVEVWMIKHKEFAMMVRKGRDEYDGANVENALLKKCLGYTFEEKSIKRIKIKGKTAEGLEVSVPATEIVMTTKHMSPDTKAIMFWLQNRNSARWKNMTYIKADIEQHTSHVEVNADITNMKSEDIRALRDIIVAQQQKAIPEECERVTNADLDTMLDKARGVRAIEDAIIVPQIDYKEV